MEKVCYVIMPFGGDDDDKKNHYLGVFTAIIEPAVRAAGYIAKREDFTPAPGNIPRNIIQNLAQANMVIADLSEGNANVFYELGIRHVFLKGKTVLICEENSKLYFDINNLNIIMYNDDLHKIAEVQEKIKQSILSREQLETVSDNPVHDCYNFLPSSILDYMTNNDDVEKKKLRELQSENASLRKKLETMGMTSDELLLEVDAEPLSAAFERIKKAIPYSGMKAVYTLRQYAENNDLDTFLTFLQNALMYGDLDETNFSEIAYIAKKFATRTIRRLILETAHRRYPDSDDILILLIDVYNELPETHDKAVQMCEKIVGISWKNGKVVLPENKLATINQRMLAALYDSYSACKQYEQSKQVSLYLLDTICPFRTLLHKYLAVAYMRLGEHANAENSFKNLFNTNFRRDGDHSLYSRYLYSRQRYRESYIEDEIALALDPADIDNYLEIAGDILDLHLIRTSDGIIEDLDRQTLINAVMPFLIKAQTICTSSDELTEIKNFMMRNHIQADLILCNIETFNDYPLLFCLDLDINFLEEQFKASLIDK